MVLPRATIYAGASKVIIGTGLIGSPGFKHRVCLFSTITVSLAAMISQVGKAEGRALADFTLHPDLSSMQLDKLL
jgi:hypothetical protein